MVPTHKRIHIIGAGLAGSEAALQLAKRRLPVTLHDIKPHQKSPAHHSPHLAEIVCSNSFGSQGDGTASGLLKMEMTQLGCELLGIAQQVAVPAGKALAVDRDKFSEAVTQRIQQEPLITFVSGEITELPQDADLILIATGPLTTSGLSKTLGRLVNREQLYFFDAASPIIVRDSINFDVAFYQDRYQLEPGKTAAESSNSYINCPLNKEQYEHLVDFILQAEKIELKSFEKESASFFESCLPVEVIASRGKDTLRFGPMKPVGLLDPHTGKRPYAVVQLRQDNAEGTLYNMVGFQTNLKWGAQKEMIQLIPGLKAADVVRYGVMHRNTYLHSPEVLLPTLQVKTHPHIYIGGQLTGTEGYTESIATGLVAALNMARMVEGLPPITLPAETMLGALLHYITREEAIGKNFQPINSNWGILPELTNASVYRKNKPERNRQYVKRAIEMLNGHIHSEGLLSVTAAGAQ